MTKKQKLNAIWARTHPDYKSIIDGVREIMICRGATCLVPLSSLTDQEIEQRSYYWNKK